MDRASELVLYGFSLRTDFEVIRWPDRYRDGRARRSLTELMNRLVELRRSYRPWQEVASGNRNSYHRW